MPSCSHSERAAGEADYMMGVQVFEARTGRGESQMWRSTVQTSLLDHRTSIEVSAHCCFVITSGARDLLFATTIDDVTACSETGWPTPRARMALPIVSNSAHDGGGPTR